MHALLTHVYLNIRIEYILLFQVKPLSFLPSGSTITRYIESGAFEGMAHRLQSETDWRTVHFLRVYTVDDLNQKHCEFYAWIE